MDSRIIGLLCCLLLAGCLAVPQGSGANNTAPKSVPAGSPSILQPDCASDNAKPTLSMSYELRGPDYLRFTLYGKDDDNDPLVYSLGVTDTDGNPVGNISLNPDHTYTWTYTTGYVKYVVATASVSDTRNGNICSTVVVNQTVQAVIHNSEAP